MAKTALQELNDLLADLNLAKYDAATKKLQFFEHVSPTQEELVTKLLIKHQMLDETGHILEEQTDGATRSFLADFMESQTTRWRNNLPTLLAQSKDKNTILEPDNKEFLFIKSTDLALKRAFNDSFASILATSNLGHKATFNSTPQNSATLQLTDIFKEQIAEKKFNYSEFRSRTYGQFFSDFLDNFAKYCLSFFMKVSPSRGNKVEISKIALTPAMIALDPDIFAARFKIKYAELKAQDSGKHISITKSTEPGKQNFQRLKQSPDADFRYEVNSAAKTGEITKSFTKIVQTKPLGLDLAAISKAVKTRFPIYLFDASSFSDSKNMHSPKPLLKTGSTSSGDANYISIAANNEPEYVNSVIFHEVGHAFVSLNAKFREKLNKLGIEAQEELNTNKNFHFDTQLMYYGGKAFANPEHHNHTKESQNEHHHEGHDWLSVLMGLAIPLAQDEKFKTAFADEKKFLKLKEFIQATNELAIAHNKTNEKPNSWTGMSLFGRTTKETSNGMSNA